MSAQLQEDTLYLAATRPALFAGVPLPVAVLFLMVAGLVIIIMQNPLYELTILPLWFGAKTIVKRDYHAANVVYMFLRTSALSLDSAQWGGASVSPNPIRVPKCGRGML
jgi:type IV secretion system protein VirB3